MKIFSYIKERVTIFDVVNEYTTLKKAGTYFKAQCPFHHEKTASFTISPEKNIFYCFGCHESGDVIAFFAKIEHCGQLEAAKLLAEKYNITLPQNILSQPSLSVEQKELYITICSNMREWCNIQRKKNNAITKYLIDRGFTPEIIDTFKVGYFPGGQKSIQNFIAFMRTKHLLLKDIIATHILAEGRAVVYSPFENRIIFPISEVLGRTIGFGGRVFKPEDTRVKYYNSRENDYFSKGSILFGLEQAKLAIQKTKQVFLVEGYTDCLAMVQYGYKNTVATLGTACTISHLKQLARYADTLYFVYDGDKAGRQALLRSAQLCWQVSIEPFVVQLPKEDDPASYLVKNKTITDLVADAQNIFSFFIHSSGENFSHMSLQKKMGVIKSSVSLINNIEDPLKKTILLQTAAKTFNLPVASLTEEINKKEPMKNASFTKIENTKNEAPIETSKLENRFFCGIITNISLLENEYVKHIIPFLPEIFIVIITKIKNKFHKQSNIPFQEIYQLLNEKERTYINQILITDGEFVNKETTIQIAIQLQKKQWKKIVLDIKSKLVHAKQYQNNEIITELLEQLILVQKKLQFSNPDTTRIHNDQKK